jgi:hypothetical protein
MVSRLKADRRKHFGKLRFFVAARFPILRAVLMIACYHVNLLPLLFGAVRGMSPTNVERNSFEASDPTRRELTFPRFPLESGSLWVEPIYLETEWPPSC